MTDETLEAPAYDLMSDEAFMAQSFEAEELTAEEPILEEETLDEELTEETDTSDEEEESTEELEESDDDLVEEEGEAEPDLEEDESSDEETDEVEEEEESPEATDFEKQILAPFKANGKMMQVGTADEAVRLMQMGANYNKKMSSIKPQLKIIKMLENNELLDEGKLNHLIDLSRNDKGAITKLLKDANIDPLDLDEDGTEYAPKSYTVSDQEMNLDEVLGSIKETDTYSQTIDVVSTKWDDSSRQALVANPNQIAVINDHIGSGIYKQITDVVEQQRVLGNITESMSDIEAYEFIGAKLYPQAEANQPKQEKSIPFTPKKTKADSPKLKTRKKALAAPKAAKAKKVDTVVDDSKLSDEDFLKQFS